jgi:hypothetical protein
MSARPRFPGSSISTIDADPKRPLDTVNKSQGHTRHRLSLLMRSDRHSAPTRYDLARTAKLIEQS